MRHVKHTPGPWAISRMIPDAIGVSSSFENGYVPIYYTPLTEEAEANARLIAAAPDLLETCEWVLEEVTLLVPGRACNPLIFRLRAAIAKAKGGAA